MNTELQPKLSIIVIFHNMRREAARTLYSLSSKYQLGACEADYEVIAIDNASQMPLNADELQTFGDNFRYFYYETDSISPSAAINFGARKAKGDYIAIIVDGARMVTPGLIRETLRAIEPLKNPFVIALGWHLGPGVQNKTMLEGYDQAEEDRLLAHINWQENGYGLFNISALAPSSGNGFFGGMPAECSWASMSRKKFIQMGGYDERFQSAGGGLVNHDFLNRIMEIDDISPVIILSEGSFHQIHGGVATNAHPDHHPFRKFAAEYKTIHNRDYKKATQKKPLFYSGELHRDVRKFISKPK